MRQGELVEEIQAVSGDRIVLKMGFPDYPVEDEEEIPSGYMVFDEVTMKHWLWNDGFMAKIKCPDCDNDGWVTCDECDGKNSKCEECNGEEPYPCYQCNGSGYEWKDETDLRKSLTDSGRERIKALIIAEEERLITEYELQAINNHLVKHNIELRQWWTGE